MKIGCGQRFKRLHHWHRWFAWQPTRVGANDCRWLEFIERKGSYWDEYGGWEWFYRIPPKPEPKHYDYEGPDNGIHRLEDYVERGTLISRKKP